MAVLAALALVAGACGDDGGLPGSSDQAFVEAVVLSEDDVPTGFVEEPVGAGAGPSGVGGFEECLEGHDVDPALLEGDDEATTAHVERSFVRDETLSFVSIAASVTAFEDAEGTEAFDDVAAVFGEDEFLACFEGVMADQLARRGDADVAAAAVEPAVDVDAGFGLAVDVDIRGTTVTMRMFMVMVDRFGVVVSVTATDDPGGPPAMADDAVATMVGRIRSTLG